MRRILLGAFVGTVAFAVVPATSLAHGKERGDRHREHARHHHRRHHHQVRHERIGADSPGRQDAGSAGMIMSFTGGVLKITLNDRSTVSGMVTDATRITCEAPEGAEMAPDDRGSGDGDRGEQGERGRHDGDQRHQGDDQADQGEERQCSTDDLKPGTAVQEADLKISSAGSVWEDVELQAPVH